jgi:hypothetical protein
LKIPLDAATSSFDSVRGIISISPCFLVEKETGAPTFEFSAAAIRQKIFC